jgi:hypothetical protein
VHALPLKSTYPNGAVPGAIDSAAASASTSAFTLLAAAVPPETERLTMPSRRGILTTSLPVTGR